MFQPFGSKERGSASGVQGPNMYKEETDEVYCLGLFPSLHNSCTTGYSVHSFAIQAVQIEATYNYKYLKKTMQRRRSSCGDDETIASSKIEPLASPTKYHTPTVHDGGCVGEDDILDSSRVGAMKKESTQHTNLHFAALE